MFLAAITIKRIFSKCQKSSDDDMAEIAEAGAAQCCVYESLYSLIVTTFPLKHNKSNYFLISPRCPKYEASTSTVWPGAP